MGHQKAQLKGKEAQSFGAKHMALLFTGCGSSAGRKSSFTGHRSTGASERLPEKPLGCPRLMSGGQFKAGWFSYLTKDVRSLTMGK